MENTKKICQALLQKSGSEKIAKQFGLEGCGRIQLVVALYDNQTWEYIAAFGGSSYERHEHGKEPHLSMMLKGKTPTEARAIIKEFFENRNIKGNIMEEEPA